MNLFVFFSWDRATVPMEVPSMAEMVWALMKKIEVYPSVDMTAEVEG